MKLLKAISFAFSFLFLMCVITLAHKGATGVVKERMDGMSAMKEAMAVIGNMLKGKTDFDSSLSTNAVNEIKFHAESMNKLFPDNEESRQHASQARIELWDEWQKFEELSQTLIMTANELQNMIASVDQDKITSAFQQVGKACSECHRNYRIKN